MKRFTFTLSFLLIITTIFSQSAHSGADIHEVVVKKVIQTSNYTYLNVVENDAESWIAAPKMDAEVGKTYYHTGGMEMRNFKSSELDTVFYSIYFMGSVLDESALKPPSNTPKVVKDTLIAPMEGGISIAELIENASQYENKTLRLRGQVVKFSAGIMGRNWVHLDDGSSSTGKSDLTITTHENASLGDILIFEGSISLNKDFGGGYFYKVIMENGQIIK